MPTGRSQRAGARFPIRELGTETWPDFVRIMRSTMACGVGAGASHSTSNPVRRTGRLHRGEPTNTDLCARIDPTPPSSTTGRTSSAGVSSVPRLSSRAAWEASASWVWLRPTGGSRASSSTVTGGSRESGKRRWRGPFASSPPTVAGRSMAIQSPPAGNPTRTHSCGVELNQCSPMPDSVRSVLSVPARSSCGESFAGDEVSRVDRGPADAAAQTSRGFRGRWWRLRASCPRFGMRRSAGSAARSPAGPPPCRPYGAGSA
jgi:hypothetical protein